MKSTKSSLSLAILQSYIEAAVFVLSVSNCLEIYRLNSQRIYKAYKSGDITKDEAFNLLAMNFEMCEEVVS